jgi:hypothetical protein
VLRACKRVLVPGGGLVFDAVVVPDTLSDHDDDEDDYGFVATAVPYVELLVQAGFVEIGSRDTTLEYLEVAGRWLVAARELETELRTAVGDEIFDDKYKSRAVSYEMIKAGELGRTLCWARKSRDDSPQSD